MGPNFVKPEAPASEAWVGLQMPPSKTGAAEEGVGAESPGIKSGASDYSDWWKTFGDPVLDTLVEKAHLQNLTLQIAGIR